MDKIKAYLNKTVQFSFIGFILIVIACFTAQEIFQVWWLYSENRFLEDLIKPAYWALLRSISFWWSPLVVFVIPVLFVMSVLFPAHPGRAVFSESVKTDVFWSLTRTTLVFFVLIEYMDFLHKVVSFIFDPDLFGVSTAPDYVNALAAFLAIDFLYWFRHYILHKVPIFWHFHSIHHSQTELNAFSIDRIHPIEFLISLTLVFAPMLIITRSLQLTIGYYLLWRSYDAFVHSNIKINLGILRFIFVTPQSHCVHHSREVEHFDQNFGSVLSIWDQIFRTQNKDCLIYPKTGIPTIDFPLEQSGKNVCVTVAKQLAYPFIAIRRDLNHIFNRKLFKVSAQIAREPG